MDLNKILQFIVALVGIHILFGILLVVSLFFVILPLLYTIPVSYLVAFRISDITLTIGLIATVGYLSYMLFGKSKKSFLLGMTLEIGLIIAYIIYIGVMNLWVQ
jgi:hypothetical protein